MPSIHMETNHQPRHSDDMQDIITTVPSWILRWGITLFFCLLTLIIGLSALIHYPDIIKARLKIQSASPSKPVVSKLSAKLVKLLVTEDEMVKQGQLLAYLESTARHDKVLALLTNLEKLRREVLKYKIIDDKFFNQTDNIQFGELQASYQTFMAEDLVYRLSIENDFSLKKRAYLQKGLDNQMQGEKAKFLQALNNLISKAEEWKSKYILSAPQTGKISFAGIVEENQMLSPNQEVFYINPVNEEFFGEMEISQNGMGKIKEGQKVLVKLKSYPFEEYGMLRGQIKYISDLPYKDSVFISKVDFKTTKTSDLKKPIHLKQGMIADAEIVTQDATILQRLGRIIFKTIGTK